MSKRRQRRLRGKRRAYAEGGEVDELYEYQGESNPEIRSAPNTSQQDINYDDRWLQQQNVVEGGMESLGTEPDPDLDASGYGIREHENWPYTEEGEEDLTPGRRAGLRSRSYERGGPVKGDREHAVLRKMSKAPKRGYLKKTGYATGGEVGYGVSGPVMMSTALNARSHNPDHAVEDAGPLATRPEGAPEAPEYRRGGPVRKIGYQEGGEVDEDEDEDEAPYQEEPEIPEPEEEEPIVRAAEGLPSEEEEESPTAEVGAAEEGGEEEGGEEEGGEEEEGGGGRQRAPQEEEGEEEGGAPTGYNAPPRDQSDRDPEALRAQEEAAEGPVGYQPQQAAQDDPEQQLRDVLAYTRKQFGLTNQTVAQPPGMPPIGSVGGPSLAMQPGEDPTKPIGAVGGPSLKYTPPPTPAQASDTTAPVEGKLPPTIAPEFGQPMGSPAGAPPPTIAPQRGQPMGQALAAAPQQQLQQYLKGERNFTPEQMTQMLDRATQENPHLDQSGSIRKAFQDLVGRGDMDGASRFVQSLRPSYDNLRAAMVAATSQGKFVEALQIAERLNNLIPNGNQVSLHPTENGLITAIVRPENGQPARTYHLTPNQFQDYAKGAGSVFDIAADAGIDRTLQAAMQRPAVNPEEAPPYQVAGMTMGPPTGAPENQPTVGGPPAPEGGVPTPRPRPMEAAAAEEQRNLGVTRESQAGAPGTQVAQRAGDVVSGGKGPFDRYGLSRAQRQAQGWEDVRSGGFPLGPRPPASAATAGSYSQKYGNRVFDQDGWPTGIPRGGQFTRDMRYYDVGGRTYDVDRNGLPLAQQGQPGWQPPARGQRGWTGTTEPFNPQMPTVGRDPITGRPSYNPNAIRPDQQQQQAPDISRDPRARYDFDTKQWTIPAGAPSATGYQNSPARQLPTPAGWGGTPAGAGQRDPTNPNITLYPARPQAGQQPPQTTGQGQQTQQPQQTAQRQDPNLRPDGTLRQYGQPYHGTPEQKRAQYQADMREYPLRQRAFQAYPHVEDQGKRQQYLDRLKNQQDIGERSRQSLDMRQKQLDLATRRLDALSDNNVQNNLRQLITTAENNAMKDLLQRRSEFYKQHKDDPDAKFVPDARDMQLLDRMHNRAIENDLYEQLRPKLRTDPNAAPAKPVAPAAPAEQTTAPKTESTNPRKTIDGVTYEHDGKGWKRVTQ